MKDKLEYRELSLVSSLSINNTLKITVYDEHTHEIASQYEFSINNDVRLKEVYRLIDSLNEDNIASDDYLCPINELNAIISKTSTYAREEMLVITLAGSIREEELILYDSDIKQLSARDVDDIKHIVYEDYKLYLACSNIIFRFETIRGEYFYIKLNSAHSDISVKILDEDTNRVRLEFATLIKEGSDYPFDEVDFITTIDTTRSIMLTLKDVDLKSFVGVDPLFQGKKPVRFVFEGFSVNSI